MLRRADPQTRKRLERSEVYFPYFSVDLRFDDQDARALLDPVGIRATPIGDLDVVTVDHLADAILALGASAAATGRTFHVVGGEDATTLGELTRLAARRFDRPTPRLVPPRMYRAAIAGPDPWRSPRFDARGGGFDGQ
jgi:nucleoside-diphosphate-sugar epimerase